MGLSPRLFSFMEEEMQFADGSSIPPEYLGLFVLAALLLLGGAATVKSLLSTRADKEAVPRKDFDELKTTVNTQGNSLTTVTAKLSEYVTRTELTTMRNELTQQLEKIDQYARGRNHKLAEKVSELQLSMEALHRNIQSEITAFVGRLMDKMERNQNMLVELRTSMERRMPQEKDQQ